MALVTFEAISATLLGGAGESSSTVPGPSVPDLSYRVRLSPGDSIKLATGDEFTSLQADLVVHLDTQPAPEFKEKAVGMIGYLDELRQVYAQVWVPRSLFEQLLAAARVGRLPSSIMVDAEGMEYTWGDPKWDNKTHDHLKLLSCTFAVPLYEPAGTAAVLERRPYEEGMPATRKQFDQLVERIERLTVETKRGLTALLWAVIVGLALFLLSRWRS